MKTLVAISIAASALAIPAATQAATYPGPNTNVCETGDAYVGPASAPIMCWPTNNCPYLMNLPSIQGCPPAATPAPSPVPTPAIHVFPGEHGPNGAVVHPVPTPAPQVLAATPDAYVYFAGSYWSF